VSLDDELLRAAYQRHGHDRIRRRHPTEGQLKKRKLALFQRAQRLIERRHLSERLVLLRQQRDHRQQCQETGQDPYLSFTD